MCVVCVYVRFFFRNNDRKKNYVEFWMCILSDFENISLLLFVYCVYVLFYELGNELYERMHLLNWLLNHLCFFE